MKKIIIIFLSVFIVCLVSCSRTTKTTKETLTTTSESLTDEEVKEKLNGLKTYGIDLFQSADTLPLLNSFIQSEQQSSYSRNNNNADGFGLPGNVSGELSDNSLIRQILYLNQPGVIYRMWFTTWDNDATLRIYIDGSTKPTYSLKLQQLTSGQNEPFVKPFVFDNQESSGGFVSYFPIIFKESIKIIASGNFYYNINYQKYPHLTKLEYDDLSSKVEDVKMILENCGNDPKITDNDIKEEKNVSLTANGSLTLYDSSIKGTVTSLKINIPSLKTWEFDRTEHKKEGIIVLEGNAISFKMNVSPTELNVLSLQGIMINEEQKASVKVDGVDLGKVIFQRRRLGNFEWKDSEYFKDQTIEIPKSITYGKQQITITLKAESRAIYLFDTNIYTNNKLYDSFNLRDDSERNSRLYFETANSGLTEKTLEYDPNDLISEDDWQTIYRDEELVNNIFIRISYKDTEGYSVYAPISSFFGFGMYGMFKSLGILVGLDSNGTMYSYYPMPNESGIKIELINKNNIDFNNIKVEVSHETNQFESGEYGYFKANYVEHNNDDETRLKSNVPIEFIKTTGSGKIVGITHSMSGSYFGLNTRFYLEGDEQIYIDGNYSHSFNGTGTEDFYNGGWYFKNGVQDNHLFGQINHNYRDNRDRTVMVRTMLTDPIYFKNGIEFYMEHGGNNDRTDCDVDVLVYYYHITNPSIELQGNFSVGDDEKTSDHNYITASSTRTKNIVGYHFEGYYKNKATPNNILNLISEYSSFTLNINPNNSGVILRRENDMFYLGQMAKVYVDGVYLGIWNSSFRNASENYVRLDDLYIPKEFTEGKTKINIKIEFNNSGESLLWTESYYEYYIIK